MPSCYTQVVEALERGVPADGGPALKQTADIRLGQTVTRVELVDHGVAVHIEGQVGAWPSLECTCMCEVAAMVP